MSLAFKFVKSREAFYETAVDHISGHLRGALDNRGASVLLLSGGSTPGPIYENLSAEKLAWENVTVGLIDERWVDEDDAGSNAALIKRTLLQNQAKVAAFVPMKTDDEMGPAAQDKVEALYADLITPDTLAVLGMGTDGHICSWFPNADGLDAAINPENANKIQGIKAKKSKATGDYLERMTITLSALETCQSILLLITGDEKRAIIERAFESHNTDLPVSHLIRMVGSNGAKGRLTILHAP